MKLLYLCLTLCLWMTGCAPVCVLRTTDPYRQISQAYRLMDEGQLLMAEDLLKQALVGYTEAGEKTGMADAYLGFGNLYKNESYHGKCAEAFQAAGTYDPTYSKSVENFSKARDLYEERSEESGVIQCLMGLGNAYGAMGDRVASCKTYHEAKQRYETAVRADLFGCESLMPGKTKGELIDGFIKADCP